MNHVYGLAGPEIFLAIAAMVQLMVGVFSRSGSAVRVTCWLAVLTMIVALVLVVTGPEDGVTFAGMFVSDSFARFVKVLILGGSAVSIIMSMSFIEREQMNRFEYPVLITIATLGMMMMVSANDLMSLYLGLELQSLPLYVLAAFRRDSVRATEAGLKYFVLGALSSGMLLYGCSMIYGFTGATSFDGIAAALQGTEHASLGLIIGIVFLSAGLENDWRQIIWFISVLSMVLGAFAAIGQTNIKRLMAYSSIGHVGYALIGLAAASPEGVRGVLIYLTIYLVMNLGTFACILAMRRGEHMVEGLDDLKGLAKTHPGMALALAVFMFSLAGIPPLAGFFGKFYVFMSAVNAGLYVLAVIGVVSSVVGAFYYLRIVKLMYFDEAEEPLSRSYGRDLGLIMGVAAFLVAAFVIVPFWLVESAGDAARSLFG